MLLFLSFKIVVNKYGPLLIELVIDISNDTKEGLPQTILTVGEIPDEAPEKEFIAEKLDDEFIGDEDIDDEFGDFDEFDYNEY